MPDVLSHAAEDALRYGPVAEHHRELWLRHRERLMVSYTDGSRPAGWWAFEHSDLVCGFGQQFSTLFEAGLLGAQERDRLMARWRAAFDRCLQPGMTRRERIAHLRWVDIPQSLFDKWVAEATASRGQKPRQNSRLHRDNVAAESQSKTAGCGGTT